MNKWTLRLAGVIWDNSGADQYYESARWGKLLHDVWIKWKCCVCGVASILREAVSWAQLGMRSKQPIGAALQTRYLSSGITWWRDAQKRFWKWSVVKPVDRCLRIVNVLPSASLVFKLHWENASKQIRSAWRSQHMPHVWSDNWNARVARAQTRLTRRLFPNWDPIECLRNLIGIVYKSSWLFKIRQITSKLSWSDASTDLDTSKIGIWAAGKSPLHSLLSYCWLLQCSVVYPRDSDVTRLTFFSSLRLLEILYSSLFPVRLDYSGAPTPGAGWETNSVCRQKYRETPGGLRERIRGNTAQVQGLRSCCVPIIYPFGAIWVLR